MRKLIAIVVAGLLLAGTVPVFAAPQTPVIGMTGPIPSPPSPVTVGTLVTITGTAYMLDTNQKLTPYFLEVRVGAGADRTYDQTTNLYGPIPPRTSPDSDYNWHNKATGSYTYDWDTTGYAPGTYTLLVRIGLYDGSAWNPYKYVEGHINYTLTGSGGYDALIVHPDSLNVHSEGKPVTAYIFKQDATTTASITSIQFYVRLNTTADWSGPIPVFQTNGQTWTPHIEDNTTSPYYHYMVAKFDRAAVEAVAGSTVTGSTLYCKVVFDTTGATGVELYDTVIIINNQ